MKHFLTLSSALLLCCSLFAQTSKVEGRILDEKGQNLAYANVLILKSADSSLVKAAISENDGRFEITEVPNGAYLLKVMMLGYGDQFQRLDLDGGTKTLPNIRLEIAAQTLSTAEIVARKPFLEQRAGTMIVNVANSLTAQSGSVLDVLRKVPGMIVVNDRISLAGQSGLTILIDGRPTQYMDMQSLLRDMPSANIDRIEVISQPGSQYDAQGTGAVLNIILKRNIKLGTNGNLTLGGGVGRFWKYRASGSINYRKNKVNLTNLLAFNHRTGFERLLLDRQVGNELFRQSNEQPFKPYSLNFKTGIDYYLDKRQTIGASVNTLGASNRVVNENLTSILSMDDLQKARAELLTSNTVRRRSGFVNGDAYYEFKIDTFGQKLSADFSINRYGRNVQNTLETRLQAGSGDYPDRIQKQPGNTGIEAYRLDYVKPIGKALKLETGLKYSHAVVDNDLQATVFQENVWQNDSKFSNHFIFTEEISAAYLSGNLKVNKIEAQFGLRYENSLSSGYSVTLDSTQNRRISRLFPSLSISAPVAGKLGANLAYSSRINRPNYNSLNPFVQFLDPYTYRKGNPFLRPELTDSYKASLTFDNQPFFSLEYSKTNNVIQMITQQDVSTGIGFGIDDNLATFERIGGSLFFPLSFVKKLDGYGGVMVYYNKYNSEVFSELYAQGRWNVTAFLQGTYTLPKDWKVEIGGWYNGPGIEGIQKSEHLYSVSMGVQKKFLDNKLNFNFSWDDIFFRYWNGRINHAGFVADIQSQWEMRIASVSLTYNFGNQYLKKGERRRSGASEEQRRTSDK
jgi:ferric enterobactin receptor